MKIEKWLLTIEQLEALPTPRLLAYFRKRSVDDESDLDWHVEYLEMVKSMLNKREHVSRG